MSARQRRPGTIGPIGTAQNFAEGGNHRHIGNIGPESINVVAPASYNDFDDKPSINEVELIGNKELPDLQVESLTNLEIEALINSIV